MTQKLMSSAVVLVLVLPGAALAVAQGDPQPTVVKEGAVAQEPAVLQQAPVPTVGPVSRPGKWSGGLVPQGVTSVLLTADDCKNLGGTVNDVSTKTCASGNQCVTAGLDGVIRKVCIDKK